MRRLIVLRLLETEVNHVIPAYRFCISATFFLIHLNTNPKIFHLRYPRTFRSPLYGHIPIQMTAGLMRRLFSSSTRAQFPLRSPSNYLTAPRLLGLKQYQRTITDVRPRQASISRTWFTSTSAFACPEASGSNSTPPDERTLKLGNSKDNRPS